MIILILLLIIELINIIKEIRLNSNHLQVALFVEINFKYQTRNFIFLDKIKTQFIQAFYKVFIDFSLFHLKD